MVSDGYSFGAHKSNEVHNNRGKKMTKIIRRIHHQNNQNSHSDNDMRRHKTMYNGYIDDDGSKSSWGGNWKNDKPQPTQRNSNKHAKPFRPFDKFDHFKTNSWEGFGDGDAWAKKMEQDFDNDDFFGKSSFDKQMSLD